MKVIAGLGNPGRRYEGTRHNIGFDVLDAIDKQVGGIDWRAKFDARLGELTFGGERTLLVAPQTYMNLSGRSIRAVINFYRLPTEELIVVCDDMNLDFGKLRLRRSGSAGGQKGLNNTINQLGTDAIARMRIGIGRPPATVDPANYVLQRFSGAERDRYPEVLDTACAALECWVREGIDAAMNKFN